MEPIYLDHNATSPLDPDVLDAMRPIWLAGGNPESRHAAGRAARRALLQATETVAQVLHAHPSEVIFTSGGTEANNLAIFGLAGLDRGPGHVVSSAIEHPAVAEPVAKLETRGFAVSHAEVSSEGLADPDAMAASIRPDTRLVTLILAHNEMGAIQPVGRLAELAGKVPIHTDAVQAVGRIPVDFHALGVATLAASGHKFGGPVGVGLLLARRGVTLEPWILGGGQQAGRRPGTIPVALIVGLAAALEKWHRDREAQTARWTLLRDRLQAGLLAALGPDCLVRNGPTDPSLRLPQTLHLGFPGRDGDILLMHLDQSGIRASLGSACASGTTQPSASLIAMRIPPDRLRSSVRFSLGAATTEAEIEDAIVRIARAIGRLDGVV